MTVADAGTVAFRHSVDGAADLASGDKTTVPEPPGEVSRHPRYRVVRYLGGGGMGTVYMAEHRLMEGSVALKVIHRRFTANPAVADRFRREIKAAARLSHPNIVTAYDAEQAGDTHFLVMEFVEGQTLTEYLRQRGPLPVHEACAYARQAALALQHAHERGMVHRDVKPDNLMLVLPAAGASDAIGTVKVMDFGLASLLDSQATATPLTGTDVVLGTADYMAPEQILRAHDAEPRSDIYSLGCTLYRLLTGRVPYPCEKPVDKMIAHLEQPPAPLAELRPDAPAALAAVLQRMLAKDPDERYGTAAEVAAALEPFARANQAADRGRTELSEKTPVHGPSRRWFVIATAMLLFLVAGFLGSAVYRIATDKGELVIETDNEDVEVVVSKNGEVVKIIDTKSGKHVTLKSGDYELALKEGPEGLKLSPVKMTLKRGETVLARIERVPKPPADDKVGEVRCFEGHNAEVWSVALSADGRLALSTGNDHTVRLWNLATGEQLHCFEGQVGDFVFVAFSPDSRTAFCGNLNCVRRWDVASGKELPPLRDDMGRVRSLAISGDGQKLLAGGTKAVVLWDLQTGTRLQRLDRSDYVHCAALSPDTTRILTGADEGRTPVLRLWDANTGKEIRRFEGHRTKINNVVFSPDGRLCVSGGWGGDNAVRVWDVATGQELRRIPTRASLEGLAFLPDGQRVLGSLADNTLYLWDVRNGEQLHAFQGHTASVMSVAVSRDGRYALTGSRDGTLRLWRLPDPSPAREKP
jgi:WD40 repeat protein